jgi:hypothetical protein
MQGFTEHRLDDAHALLSRELPAELRLVDTRFDELWNLHPETFHEIKMHGKLVKTPRWQQAYGADYRYTGNTNRALPVPSMLEPLHRWAREQIDPRLNGLLLNWYDAERGQYIGKHRDSTIDMLEGAPIVTVSYGSERVLLDYAKFGIRANALVPGYFATDLNRDWLASPSGDRMKQRIPFRRSGELDELDGPLLLLASDASSYMSGSALVVDGAHTNNTL